MTQQSKFKKSFGYRRSGGYLFAIFLVFLMITTQSCTRQQPSDLTQWYSEHYPDQQKTTVPAPVSEITLGSQVNENQERWIAGDEKSGNSSATTTKGSQLADDQNGLEIRETQSKTAKLRTGYLDEPIDLKYASEVRTSQYNTESVIEEKLYKLVQEAFEKRDELKFLRLYNFFLESFPQSKRKEELAERHNHFFYSESIEVDKLKDALVELTYPAARSYDELRQYFIKLKMNGIKVVQVDVVQFMDTPIYLFANAKNRQGYYFSSKKQPLVDDLLDKITRIAHENGLHLFVSFPFRHHPLIGHNDVFLMDESWSSIQNKTVPNTKLDLLNPDSRIFLKNLLTTLLNSKIDGIVFKDDFTYHITEGFSNVAQKRYLTEIGKQINFNQLFVPSQKFKADQFGVLADEDFRDIALWRSREIKQLLWDMIAFVRKSKKKMVVGIETTPEMLLDPQISIKWYSTGLDLLHDLDVDFFMLKWRKFGSQAESDPQSYKNAALALRNSIPDNKKLLMKIPLSQETKNTIKLNRRIRENDMIRNELDNSQLAIGPISRIDKFGFLK